MPLNENHLRPCMIVDNPHILRDVVCKHGAKPTHINADAVITVLADDLDEYAEEYGELAKSAWENEYITGQAQHTRSPQQE